MEILQARGSVSGPELAARLEVDARTVRRYVTMLGDLGVPVEGQPGRHGGYRLRPGYKLPPLMLTDDEAVALVLAVLDIRRLGLVFAPAVVAGLQAKLERVLPDALRQRIQAVAANVALAPPPSVEPAESGLVVLFSEAAQGGRRVRLHYRSGSGEETERAVDPYGVVRWSRAWYVLGYCHLRAGLRLFRLDRVVTAALQDETFTPPADLDIYAHVVAALTTGFPGRWEIAVALHLPIAAARQTSVATYGTLTPDGDDDGRTIFTGRVDDLDGAARWLVTLGCPLTALRPPELCDALRRLAGDIAAMAGDVPCG